MGSHRGDHDLAGHLRPGNPAPAAVKPSIRARKIASGFCPTGPVLVTPDEFVDRDDIELSCFLNGEEVQRGRTSDLIFSIPDLVEYLSHATTLYPGDLILTGTPSGIGATRNPPRFLSAGDVLESRVTGVGEMRHVFAADPHVNESAAVLSRA